MLHLVAGDWVQGKGQDTTDAGGEAGAAVRVRPASTDDLAAVARIEAASFSNPWSTTTFESLLERTGPVLLVAEAPHGTLVGYAVMWSYGDQGELANIAVAADWRGRGIGSRLMDAILDAAARAGVRELFLEVRESNTRASVMYEHRGFELVGRRPGYYDRPREDALVLVKRF